MVAYRRVDDLRSPSCKLTACTPGSGPGPTLGVEYGEAFTFTFIALCTTLGVHFYAIF